VTPSHQKERLVIRIVVVVRIPVFFAIVAGITFLSSSSSSSSCTVVFLSGDVIAYAGITNNVPLPIAHTQVRQSHVCKLALVRVAKCPEASVASQTVGRVVQGHFVETYKKL
jgi:hypothetical protein